MVPEPQEQIGSLYWGSTFKGARSLILPARSGLIVEPFLAKKPDSQRSNCGFMDSSSSSCSRSWDDRKRHATQIRSKFPRDCGEIRRSARAEKHFLIKQSERGTRKSEEDRRMELWKSQASLGIIRRIKNDPSPSCSMQISELEENVETQIQSLREHMHDEIESFMQPGFD